MKLSLKLLVITTLIALSGSIANSTERIVCIGSGITEIVNELGFGNKIVAVDDESNYPPAMADVQKIGYYKGVNTSKIMKLNPDLVIVREGAGTFISIAELRAKCPNFLMIPDVKDVDGVKGKIRIIADHLGVHEKGKQLVDQIEESYQEINTQISELQIIPKAVYIYVTPKGDIHAYGSKTDVNEMLAIAGGYNAMTYSDNFKVVENDFFKLNKIDVVVIAQDNLNQVGGLNALINELGIDKTNAGKNNNILVVDHSAFTGFGIRFIDNLAKLVNTYASVPVKNNN